MRKGIPSFCSYIGMRFSPWVLSPQAVHYASSGYRMIGMALVFDWKPGEKTKRLEEGSSLSPPTK
jgi:hypothetical protein